MGNDKNSRANKRAIPGEVKGHLQDTLKGSWFDHHGGETPSQPRGDPSPEEAQTGEPIHSSSYKKQACHQPLYKGQDVWPAWFYNKESKCE